MAINPLTSEQNTLNFNDLRRIPVQQRLEAAQSSRSFLNQMLNSFTPVEIANLFPDYYKRQLPDISGFILANRYLDAGGKFHQEGGGEQGLYRPYYGGEAELDNSTRPIGQPEPTMDEMKKALLAKGIDIDGLYDEIGEDGIQEGSEKAKILKNVPEEKLAEMGFQRFEDDTGKKYIKVAPTKASQLTDEQALAEYKKTFASDSFTPRERATLDFIAKREGARDPNIVFGGKKYEKALGLDKKPLTERTLTEVFDLQGQLRELSKADGYGRADDGRILGTSAVGSGQMIEGTLKANLKALGIKEEDFDKIKFDKTLQDKLTLMNFKTSGIGDPNADPNTWNRRALGQQYESLNPNRGHSTITQDEINVIRDASDIRPEKATDVTPEEARKKLDEYEKKERNRTSTRELFNLDTPESSDFRPSPVDGMDIKTDKKTATEFLDNSNRNPDGANLEEVDSRLLEITEMGIKRFEAENPNLKVEIYGPNSGKRQSSTTTKSQHLVGKALDYEIFEINPETGEKIRRLPNFANQAGAGKAADEYLKLHQNVELARIYKKDVLKDERFKDTYGRSGALFGGDYALDTMHYDIGGTAGEGGIQSAAQPGGSIFGGYNEQYVNRFGIEDQAAANYQPEDLIQMATAAYGKKQEVMVAQAPGTVPNDAVGPSTNLIDVVPNTVEPNLPGGQTAMANKQDIAGVVFHKPGLSLDKLKKGEDPRADTYGYNTAIVSKYEDASGNSISEEEWNRLPKSQQASYTEKAEVHQIRPEDVRPNQMKQSNDPARTDVGRELNNTNALGIVTIGQDSPAKQEASQRYLAQLIADGKMTPEALKSVYGHGETQPDDGRGTMDPGKAPEGSVAASAVRNNTDKILAMAEDLKQQRSNQALASVEPANEKNSLNEPKIDPDEARAIELERKAGIISDASGATGITENSDGSVSQSVSGTFKNGQLVTNTNEKTSLNEPEIDPDEARAIELERKAGIVSDAAGATGITKNPDGSVSQSVSGTFKNGQLVTDTNEKTSLNEPEIDPDEARMIELERKAGIVSDASGATGIIENSDGSVTQSVSGTFKNGQLVTDTNEKTSLNEPVLNDTSTENLDKMFNAAEAEADLEYEQMRKSSLDGTVQSQNQNENVTLASGQTVTNAPTVTSLNVPAINNTKTEDLDRMFNVAEAEADLEYERSSKSASDITKQDQTKNVVLASNEPAKTNKDGTTSTQKTVKESNKKIEQIGRDDDSVRRLALGGNMFGVNEDLTISETKSGKPIAQVNNDERLVKEKDNIKVVPETKVVAEQLESKYDTSSTNNMVDYDDDDEDDGAENSAQNSSNRNENGIRQVSIPKQHTNPDVQRWNEIVANAEYDSDSPSYNRAMRKVKFLQEGHHFARGTPASFT